MSAPAPGPRPLVFNAATQHLDRPPLHCLSTPAELANVPVMAINIPMKSLSPSATCLLDYNPDPVAAAPIFTLMTLLHLVNRLEFCLPGVNPHDIKSDLTRTSAVSGVPSTFTRRGAVATVSGERVVVMYEALMSRHDPTQRVGMRYWFFIHDASISLDQGIETLMVVNRSFQASVERNAVQQAQSGPKKMKPAAARAQRALNAHLFVRSTKEWVESHVEPTARVDIPRTALDESLAHPTSGKTFSHAAIRNALHPRCFMKGGGGLEGAVRATGGGAEKFEAQAKLRAAANKARKKMKLDDASTCEDDDVSGDADECADDTFAEDFGGDDIVLSETQLRKRRRGGGGGGGDSDDGSASTATGSGSGKRGGDDGSTIDAACTDIGVEYPEVAGTLRDLRDATDPDQFDMSKYFCANESYADGKKKQWKFPHPNRVYWLRDYATASAVACNLLPGALADSDATTYANDEDNALSAKLLANMAADLTGFASSLDTTDTIDKQGKAFESAVARLESEAMHELQRAPQAKKQDDANYDAVDLKGRAALKSSFTGDDVGGGGGGGCAIINRASVRAAAMRALRENASEIEAASRAISSCATTSIAAANEWIKERARECARMKTPSTLFSSDLKITDPSLDVFGNFVVMFARALEETYAIKVHHATIIHVFFAMMSCYDSHADLRVNFLLTGAPSAGKSYIIKLLMRLFIRGTADIIASATDKAFQTDTKCDRRIILADETPKHWLGIDDRDIKGDGGGDAFIKAMFASREVKLMVNVEEDGKRVLREVTNLVRNAFTMLSNVSVHQVPPAFLARSVPRDVVDVDREGHDIVDSESHLALLEGTHVGDAARAFEDFMHRLHYLRMMADMLITTGALAPPCMLTATLALKRMRAELEKRGHDTSQHRHFIKMLAMARTACITRAILTVFFTPTVVKKSDPRRKRDFDMKDILEIQPYLCSNWQDAVFAFTSLADLFVDPHEAIAIQHFFAERLEYTDKSVGKDLPDSSFAHVTAQQEQAPQQQQQQQQQSLVNRKYLSSGAVRARLGMSPEQYYAERMVSAMRARGGHHGALMNADTVRTKLVALQKRFIDGEPIIVIEGVFNALHVNRKWLDSSYTDTFDKIIMACVDALAYDKIELHRVVTGITYINSTPRMPHIMQCATLDPKGKAQWTEPYNASCYDDDDVVAAVESGAAITPKNTHGAKLVWHIDDDLAAAALLRYGGKLGTGLFCDDTLEMAEKFVLRKQKEAYVAAMRSSSKERRWGAYPARAIAKYKERELARPEARECVQARHTSEEAKKLYAERVCAISSTAPRTLQRLLAEPTKKTTTTTTCKMSDDDDDDDDDDDENIPVNARRRGQELSANALGALGRIDTTGVDDN